MADTLQDISKRLAAGSQGRTEADVQSDVRKFLLDAPLDLDGDDLTDVLLEAQGEVADGSTSRLATPRSRSRNP